MFLSFTVAVSLFFCRFPPAESNCTYFKFFTTGENAVLFQKTTQKSESHTSFGSRGLSELLSHLIRPLPPFFIPVLLFYLSPPLASSLSPCALFAPSSLSSDALSLFSSPLTVISPTIHPHLSLSFPSLSVSLHLLAALFQVGHCLLCECLKSIPPTLRSSVSELPSNLSFHWQLHNGLRSHSAVH